MTNEQKSAIEKRKNLNSFLLASVLGDSWLYGKKNKHIGMGHCEAQYEYLCFKVGYLNDNLNLNTIINKSVKKTSPSNNRQDFYCAYSRSNKKFTALYNTVYVDNKKRITKRVLDKLNDFGLAILYMDDGGKETQWNRDKTTKKIRSYTFNLNSFCLEDVKLFSSWLYNKYQIESKVYLSRGKYPIVKITKNESRDRFVRIIEPYILDCMKYKLYI